MIIPLGFLKKTVAGGYEGAYAQYEDASTPVVGTASSISPYAPDTVNADDILFILVGDDEVDTFVTPTDWNLLVTDTSSNFSYVIYWKRAVGNEDGLTVQVVSNLDGGTFIYGIMMRFSGCVTTGDPFESLVSNAPASNTGTSTLSNGLSSGDGRLAVMFYLQRDNNTVVNASTGGYATEAALITTAGGYDFTWGVYTQELPNSSSIDGTCQITTVLDEPNALIGILLKPA